MVVVEEILIRRDGKRLLKRYSDQNKYLIQDQTGLLYNDAIDVEDSGFTYSESEIDIESSESEVTKEQNYE